MANTISMYDKKTSEIALWYNPEYHSYCSQVYLANSLKNLKGKFRIVMYKNRYHKSDDNRPNYLLSIKGLDTLELDANEIELNKILEKDMQAEDMIEIIEDVTGIRLYTENDISRAKVEGARMHEYGYSIDDIF